MRAALLLAISALGVWAPGRSAADAVSWFDQRTLDRRGVETLDQLQFQVPSWVSASEGRQLALRGVGGDQVGAGAQPAFAVHQDGVYLARFAPVRVGFHDVERIEVARGPQGSLWGRNTAGVMNVIPRRAEFRTAIDLDLEYGSRENARARAMLNLPLVDDVLAFRVAVQHDRNDGFYRQRVAGDRVYDTKDTTLRAGLRWEPSDTLGFDLAYTFIDQRGGGLDSKLRGDPVATGTGGLVDDDFTGALATPSSVRVGRENRRGDLASRFHLLSLRGRLDLSQSLRLASTSAFQKHESSLLLDADHSELDVRTERRFDDVWAISQELQLRYEGAGPLSGVLGANVFHEQTRAAGLDAQQLQQTAAVQSLLPMLNVDIAPLGTPFPLDFEDRLRLDARSQNTSWDVYGNATFDWNDDLSVHAGIRVSGMHRDFDDRSVDSNSLPFGAGLAEFALTSGTRQSKSWTAITWRAGVEYRPTENGQLYATVSTGQRAGGFHTLQRGAFDDEEILAVEVGARGAFVDDRLEIGANVFWYDYEDIQLLVSVESPVVNVPSAEIVGAEVEWLVTPIDAVRWNGSFGYLHAEYGGGGPIAVEGNRLVRSPEFSLNTGIEYGYEISSRLGSLTLRGDYSFRDRVDFDPFNAERFRSSPAHIVDVRAIYQSEWNAVGLRIEAFVRNIADDEVATNIVAASSGLHEVGFYNTPRLYGGRVGATF